VRDFHQRFIKIAAGIRIAAICAAVCVMLPRAAFATNGLNLIGFGTESNAMAGADTAVARDTTALNTNPAGLTQLSGTALDIYNGLAFALDVGHQDEFGNDRRVSNTVIGLGGFGYARQIMDGKMQAGIGFFGQGGAGCVLKDLATAFGTRDELSTLFRIVKLTPGIAYRVDDKLSLGVSASIAYADLTQKVFPDTSFFNAADPAHSFFGYRLDGAHHVSFSPKLGVMYQANDWLTLGASYTARTSLPMQHGTLVSDQSSVGLGKVTYSDVHADGLALPREIALGAALRPNAKWLLSVKLDWLNWSDAVGIATLTASAPDNPAASQTLSASATHDWRDQWVVAVGGAYQLDVKTVLRMGYNYGRNPIPREHTNPLLSTITEHHLTCGVSRQLTAEWNLSAALEYARGGKVTYTNPELPFGANAAEKDNYLGLYLMASRRW
jgi:long-chain fatty acid transport protein